MRGETRPCAHSAHTGTWHGQSCGDTRASPPLLGSRAADCQPTNLPLPAGGKTTQPGQTPEGRPQTSTFEHLPRQCGHPHGRSCGLKWPQASWREGFSPRLARHHLCIVLRHKCCSIPNVTIRNTRPATRNRNKKQQHEPALFDGLLCILHLEHTTIWRVCRARIVVLHRRVPDKTSNTNGSMSVALHTHTTHYEMLLTPAPVLLIVAAALDRARVKRLHRHKCSISTHIRQRAKRSVFI